METTARDGLPVVQILGKLPLLYNAISCGQQQIVVTYSNEVNPPLLISHAEDPTDGLTFTLLSSTLTDFGSYLNAVSVTVSMVDYPAVTTTFTFNINVLQHPCVSEPFPP